jgi:acetyltransferase
LRVIEIEDLFAICELLSYQPHPRGPRLTIITNAGGPGVLTTDALTVGGGQLTPIDHDSQFFKDLNSFLPAAWSHGLFFYFFYFFLFFIFYFFFFFFFL